MVCSELFCQPEKLYQPAKPMRTSATTAPMTNNRFRLIQSMLMFQRLFEREGDSEAERARGFIFDD